MPNKFLKYEGRAENLFSAASENAQQQWRIFYNSLAKDRCNIKEALADAGATGEQAKLMRRWAVNNDLI